MCRGVQHPTRGLFLRAYLVQVCRGLLPDSGSPYEGPDGGTITDAIDFLLSNFTEMNKLWVRMRQQQRQQPQQQSFQDQPSGSASASLVSPPPPLSSAYAKREAERAQLSDLVGKNLTQLSQLEGLTFELYRDTVLPGILEQVINCKDPLAQQYLMQCIIMGFPDEYHLGTLSTLLDALPALVQPGVKLHTIMTSLLDRLAAYVNTGGEAAKDQMAASEAFDKAAKAGTQAIEQHSWEVPAGDVAAVYAALLTFAGAVHPERIDLVDGVLEKCCKVLEVSPIIRATTSGDKVAKDRADKAIVSLLVSPLERYDVLTVLSLAHYHKLVDLLSYEYKRDMARRIGNIIVGGGGGDGSRMMMMPSVSSVETLFDFLSSIISSDQNEDEDEDEMKDDALLVARIVHSIQAEDAGVYLDLLKAVQKRLLLGGPTRAAITVPALCSTLLTVQGTTTTTTSSSQQGEWFRFLLESASELADLADAVDSAFQFCIHGGCAAAAAANANANANANADTSPSLEQLAVDFFERAFEMFEENIAESKAQLRALQTCCGALYKCRGLGEKSRGDVTTKVLSYCGRLLKKEDQVSAVLACSHLFWQQQQEERTTTVGGGHSLVQQQDKVASCLRRATKIADTAQRRASISTASSTCGKKKTGAAAAAVVSFIDIANKYIYYYEAGVVDGEGVGGALEAASKAIAAMTSSSSDDGDIVVAGVVSYWRNTITKVKSLGDGTGIVVPQ